MNVVFSYGNGRNKDAERQKVNIRVYHGKAELGLDFRRTTGLEVSLKDWKQWEPEKKEFKLTGARTPDERRYILDVQDQLQSIDRTFKREFQELVLSHRLKSLNKISWNEWCEKTLDKGLGRSKEIPKDTYLIDKVVEYMEFNKTEWAKRTMMGYTTLVNCLKQFEKDTRHKYRTEEVDLKFYSEFQHWNLARGNGNHYFGSLIQKIKAVINHFRTSDVDFKFHPNIEHKKFKSIKESPEHDILTEEQLELVFNYSGSKKLENIRDLVMIQYFACLRYNELKREFSKGIDGISIHKNDEGKYFWNVLENKTNKQFKEKKNLPLHKRIQPLLLTSAKFPKVISNDKYNKYLAELMVVLGLSDLKVTTHTIRRSFCTNMWNNGHDPVSILQYSGHSSVRMLMNYIKVKNMTRKNTIPTE